MGLSIFRGKEEHFALEVMLLWVPSLYLEVITALACLCGFCNTRNGSGSLCRYRASYFLSRLPGFYGYFISLFLIQLNGCLRLEQVHDGAVEQYFSRIDDPQWEDLNLPTIHSMEEILSPSFD
ncbi:hypothetical protein BAE44_0002463 [Dichanthelium oligosanthes]|uniref:Uncharacterized protein n=1 Tax=Dichanthelium oligosanthes TaxID=888268 RepID=A0A1E5WGN0_9POAL|nr:hypothetical protein BAE44_0002463 [Dichanthelium oligosanthes]